MTAPKRPPRKARLWIAYGIFLTLIIELSLRVIFAVPQFAEILSVNDSYSWQRQWVSRHQEAQNEIYYSFDRYHPTLGWASQPNLRDIPVFDGKFLNTNDHGWRGTTDFPFERIPGKPRILLLGDSFTFGDEVSDDETYAYYLQAMLPNAEVINMGVHGYGHDQMLLLFLEEGIRYQPDIVILGFIQTDLDRNLVSFRDFAKPRFIVRDGELVLTHSPVPSPKQVLRWDWLRPRLVDGYSIIATGAETKSGARHMEEEEVTSMIFDQLVEAVRFAGAIPVFAYLPFGPEITEPMARVPGEDFFFAYCAANPDVACFSARPLFREKIGQGVALDTPFHWNPAGHQTVAEAIFDFIVRQNQFVPNP